MSDRSDLIASLAAAGSVEAKGGFTIDPEKAREKLRQYQLAEPQRYVLLLVEAAVAGGATRLEFEIDSDDVWLRFDGAGFRHDQLESIYSSLFASNTEGTEHDRRTRRALAQLAFAVNSAMALNPRFIEIVSLAGSEALTRLLLRPDAPDQLEQLAPDPGRTSINSVHVKDRFRPGLVIEFFRSLRGNLIEINLLREHCRWSRTPIAINGELLSGPIEFPGPSWTEIDVFDPPGSSELPIGSAVLGLRDPGEQRVEAHALLLSHGVYLERVPLRKAVRGFAAIVDSPRFGKDVSQTKLVRDAGFDAVIAAILAAQGQMICRLAERCSAGELVRDGFETLFEWLGASEFSGLGRARRDPVFTEVAKVPIWPLVGGGMISTQGLIDADKPIRFTPERFEFAPIELPFVVSLVGDLDQTRRALLESLFGRQLVDATANLQRELERERARLEFLARPHPPELDTGYFPIRATIRGEQRRGDRLTPIRGELGIQVIGPRGGWIRLIHAGCLLEEIPLEHPLPGLCVVVEAEFEPTEDYRRAVDGPSVAVLLTVLETLLRCMTELADSGTITPAHTELRALMREYIHKLSRADYTLEFLVQLGIERGLAKRELQRLLPDDRGVVRPIWFAEALEDCHPIARLPLFSRIHGGPCSLADLAARRAANGNERLRWLDADVGGFPAIDVEVLLLGPVDVACLYGVFGNDALSSFADRLDVIRRRDAFLDRSTVTEQLRSPTLVRTALAVAPGQPRGELGLREFGPSAVADGACPIDVFHCERRVCELELELPLPGLTAWISVDEDAIAEHFDALAEPLSIRGPVLTGLVSLVEHELVRARERPRELRRCEWWWLLMVPNFVFGFDGLGAAFVELLGSRGLAGALTELDGLLALLQRSPSTDLERALGRLRGRKQLATLAAVNDQLPRASRRPSGPEREVAEFRRALVPALGRLLAVPLLRRFSGVRLDSNSPRTLALVDLYGQIHAGEPLSWVGEDYRIDAMPTVDFAILGLDSIEQRLLAGQLGPESLELVGEWLQGRAQFERRRTISAVQISRGSVLTVVAIDGGDWRGELGIVRDPPARVQRTKIRVITDAREVAVLDLPAKPIAFVGALTFDKLALTDRFDDVTASERERIRKLVEARTDELLADFAGRYPGFDKADKLLADPIIRHLLSSWAPGTGGYAARAKHQAKLFRMFAELPVFSGARKRWSAAELAEARERGRIKTIGYRDGMTMPEGPVVLLDASDVEPTLIALFGPTHDLHAELAREREFAARKAAAPPLPSTVPVDALASVEVASEQLCGHLWIAHGPTGVLFGRDGHAAQRRTVSVQCPVAGAIVGERLTISDDWTRVVLTRSQERMLERAAVAVWSSLTTEFTNQIETPPTDSRDWVVRTRDAIHELFLRLHADFGRTRVRAGKPGKRKQGNQLEQLYAQLQSVPLFELGNGRWISAEVAERERPLELAALELWSGPSAEELAHQRAIERREAERIRKAELDAEQRADADRRKSEAEAREREASRRRAAKREAEAAEREAQAAERERSKPAPAPAPSKPNKPSKHAKPKPTPAELLVEAIREELRLVRAANHGLLSNRLLETLVPGPAVARGPLFRRAEERAELDVGHPLFVAALASYLDDPTLVTLLASAAYTFLNIVHVEIVDAHEAEFLRLHATYAGTG